MLIVSYNACVEYLWELHWTSQTGSFVSGSRASAELSVVLLPCRTWGGIRLRICVELGLGITSLVSS